MSEHKTKSTSKPARGRMKAPADPPAEGAASGAIDGDARAGEGSLLVPEEERQRLIQEEAYLRAEQRGFDGDPQQNWLEAEREVDRRLGRQRH